MKNSNKHKNKITKPRSPKGETAGIVFKTIFLCLILAAFGIIFFIGAWVDDVLAETPELDMTNISPAQSALIFDAEGELIFEFGEQRSEWVSYDDISPVMIDAIVAIEDSRFFDHYGVDWSRTIVAARHTLMGFVTGEDNMQGGSTLTQQLINQTHLLLEDGERDNTLDRKLQEIALAIEVERNLSKEQIIEYYLNIAPFGGRIFGIQAASQFYFGVDATDLTLPQAATLAGIVQLPNVFRPDWNVQSTQFRRNIVLNLMVDHGYIPPEIRDLAAAEPISDMLVYSTLGLYDTSIYQPFIDLARDEAERLFGIEDLSGYQIHTTLERDAQRFITELMSNEGGYPWPTQEIQASAVMIRNDGSIRALGHRDEINEARPAQRGFHHALHGRHQVGSASKPIWAYGPAFELLDWGTGSMVTDDLFSWGGVGNVLVRNWDHDLRGRDSVRTSMYRSWNVPAIMAYLAVVNTHGQAAMDKFVNDLGIATPPGGFTPAYAIGGNYVGITPLEMAGAYSAFANGGLFNEPFTVTHIIAPDGTRLEGSDFRRVNDRVMSEASAYMMSSILNGAVFNNYGTGSNARMWDRWLAGKTGTTNFSPEERAAFGIHHRDAVPDAWFVGYTMEHTVAVWTGHESRTEGHFLLGQQTQIPLHLFTRILTELEEPGGAAPTRPDTIGVATVEWRSGTADGQACFPSAATPSGAIRPDELFHSHAMPNCTSTRFGGTLPPPANLRAESGGGRVIDFTWDHEGEDSESVSFSQAREAFERGMSLYRAALDSHGTLTQELANLPITPGAARMIVEEIQGGAGEMEYALIGVLANGSTRELGTTNEDNISLTLSVRDAMEIRSFHVIARLGNRTTGPSNSVENRGIIDASELEIRVPNMRNWTLEELEDWIEENPGVIIYHTFEYSSQIEADRIISNSPTGRVRLDQRIDIVISSGPEQTTLPALPTLPQPPGPGDDDDDEDDDQSNQSGNLRPNLLPGLDEIINISLIMPRQ